MRDIHMAKIKIIIFINTRCVSIFFSLFFLILWCKTSTTQMAFTTAMINYIFILFVIVFIFFYYLLRTIVPFLMTKYLFEIFFMTMKIWIRCCCIHLWEQSITNLVSWILLHSLLRMKHNQFILMIFQQKLIVLFSHRRHEIIWEYLWNTQEDE